MKKVALLTALIALVAVSGGQAVASSAEGSAVEREPLSVRDAWVAEALPGQDMTAAYMIIVNEGDVEEKLVRVDSEFAERLELHTMEQQGEMMRMRKVDSIVIGPGEEVALEPGGLHIMIIGLSGRPKAGDTFTLFLGFESGASLRVDAPVKKR